MDHADMIPHGVMINTSKLFVWQSHPTIQGCEISTSRQVNQDNRLQWYNKQHTPLTWHSGCQRFGLPLTWHTSGLTANRTRGQVCLLPFRFVWKQGLTFTQARMLRSDHLVTRLSQQPQSTVMRTDADDSSATIAYTVFPLDLHTKGSWLGYEEA